MEKFKGSPWLPGEKAGPFSFTLGLVNSLSLLDEMDFQFNLLNLKVGKFLFIFLVKVNFQSLKYGWCFQT